MLENRPITGLIKSSKMDSESLQFLESTNWSTDVVSKICLVLKEKLEEECKSCWREVPSKDVNDNYDMWTQQKRHKIEDKENRVMIWLTGTRLPPRVIARKLKVSRDTIYKAARKMSKTPETSFSAGKPRRGELLKSKSKWIEIMREFVHENIHRFYTSLDVRDHLSSNCALLSCPSITTIRTWMKSDLKLSYVKVNVRFKDKWSRVIWLQKRNIFGWPPGF